MAGVSAFTLQVYKFLETEVDVDVEDLPIPEVLRNFVVKRRGIKTLYPPQEEAVRAGIFNGENILMVTATASGKTLLAELAAVNNVLTNDKKSIVTVPLKALAFEKMNDFSTYEELGIRVAVSTGDYNSEDRWLDSYDIIITTYEKLDSLLRLKPSWLWSVGQLIIDEIHYLGDSDRGPIIESIVAKLKMLNLKPQIIGLSATIGNPELIAKWLDAKLVKSTWRPVNLREGVYYNGRVFYVDGVERDLARLGDPVLELVVDALNEGGQALVFSSSRQGAVRVAKKIASLICSSQVKYINPDTAGRLAEEVREVSSSRILADELASVIRCGVSFHHAGLELEVRRVIEEGFRRGVLRALASTTTLAAGVNLPARRVIIHEYRRYEPGLGYVEIPIMEYKQMAGRAGRPGLDPYGEAIVVTSSADEADYVIDKYIKSPPEDIRSWFMEQWSLKFHVLSAIASQYVGTVEEILQFISHTLAGVESPAGRGTLQYESMKRLITRIVDSLVDYGFIVRNGERFEATELGDTVNRMYLDPDTAHIFVMGLLNAGSVENIDLYSLILISKSPKVPRVKVKRGELDELAREISINWGSIPLRPSSIDDVLNYPDEYRDLLEEFKTALVMYDWINEASEDTIMKLYDVQPGDLRLMVEQAEWLVASLQELARTLKLSSLIESLGALRYRVRYGVKPELLELVVNLEGVGRVRARALYNAGYRTIGDIASVSANALSRVPGIGERLASSIIEQARKLMGEGKVIRFGATGQVKKPVKRGGILDHLY